MQAVHQQQGGAMCETEEDERRQQHRRATTGVCERGEALCEDAEQQVRTMMLVVRESMRRRYISQRYCRSLRYFERVRQDASTNKLTAKSEKKKRVLRFLVSWPNIVDWQCT